MNVHTFKDVANSKRDSLAHDIDHEDDEDDKPTYQMKGNVDGEEENGDNFNDIGEVMEPFNLKYGTVQYSISIIITHSILLYYMIILVYV